MPDEQDLTDPGADLVQQVEHLRRRPVIEAVFVDDLRLGLQLRQHEVKRVARPPRRGAEHESGSSPCLAMALPITGASACASAC